MRKAAILLTSALLFCLSATQGFSQSIESAKMLYKESVKLIRQAQSSGDLRLAEKKLQEAQKIYKKHNDDYGIIIVSNALGILYKRKGQYKSSIDKYKKALNICKKIDERTGEGKSLYNLASVYNRIGEYDSALKYLNESLPIRKETGDHLGECYSLILFGTVHLNLGSYEKALQFLKDSLTRSQLIEDPNRRKEVEAFSYANMGQLLGQLGFISQELSSYEKALQRYKTLNYYRQQSQSYIDMGNVCQKKGELEKALSYYHKSIKMNEELGRPTYVPLNLIGMLYLEQDDLEKAEGFLRKANFRYSLALLNLKKQQYRQARKRYKKVIAFAEKIGSYEDLFIGYMGMAKAFEGLEEYEKALKNYTKAVQITEEMRSSLSPANRKNFYSVRDGGFLRSGAAEGVTRLRMKLNQSAKSIESSEVAQARSLADGLALRSQGNVAKVPNSVLNEEERLVQKSAALKRARNQKPKNEDPDRWKNLTQQIGEADAKLKKFIEKLWKEHKAYAAIKYPRPVKLKEASIKPDEYLVLYDVVGEGVGVKLIQGTKIKSTFYIDWNTNELTKDVNTFLKPFHELNLKGFNVKLGKSLCKRLIMKVLLDVPEDAPLIIIPDGVLATLPFEALVMDGQPKYKEDQGKVTLTGLTFVGDKHPISYYQSITALTLARTLGKKKKQGAKTLVMADPVFDVKDARFTKKKQTRVATSGAETYKNLMVAMQDGKTGLTNVKRLPLTGKLADELKGIYGSKANVVTGLDVNKDSFFKKIAPKISRYKDVIFATHGYYGTDLPGIQEPVLLFSLTPPGTDGFLRMTEVMSLDMNADTVALTACQTGLGKHVSGEGVMNLGRAFQYAGAKSVLMSLWSVSEAASVHLVKNFFQYKNEGKSKLEALQLARKDIRKAGYDHPFFWAAFILAGEAD